MAKITEFCGYRYNPKAIKDENLGLVMTPPYDTISSKEQQEYYNNEEHNIIRVSKGIINEDDTDEDNCYTRAKDYINEWIEKGVLKKEEEPVLYLYEQKVKYHETMFVNHGIVALLELSELEEKQVIPCEKPTASFANDRFNLISKTNANVDMINCMYIDPEKTLSSLIAEISDKKPDVEFCTDEKVIETQTFHKIWVIRDKERIEFIKSTLKEKTFFITDGHNRYITALKYKNQCKNNKDYNEDSPCNYIMALCTNAFGNRMVQLPVHRLINPNKKFNEDFFISCAQDNFKVEKIIVDTSVDEISQTMKKQIATVRMDNRFALYCGENYFYRLTLKNESIMKKLLPEMSEAYCGLDVTVFNKLILEDILNITEDEYDKYVSYTKRATKGVSAVREKEAECLFVLNPVKAEQIREVSLSGDAMPDRTIYIFPKPATGVIIHKF